MNLLLSMTTKTYSVFQGIFFRRPLKTLILLPLFLMGEWNYAFPQIEYIKEVYPEKTEFSIVRVIDSTQRLVCNVYADNSSFMLYSDLSSVGLKLCLPTGFRVSDFIIRDDTVYFCGKRTIAPTYEDKAIMGYFGLAGFPSTTVYYYNYSAGDYVLFNKIESYKVYYESRSEFHIVMTAKTSTDKWTMIDSHRIIFDDWVFYSLQLSPDSLMGHTLGDIAVTDNYVLATSSGTVFDIGSYLWYFNKPTVLQSHIFSVEVRRCKYPGQFVTRANLKRCENNRFVTACRDKKKIYIDEFDGATHNYRLSTTYFVGTFPREIKYNYDKNEIDILLYFYMTMEDPMAASYILHIPHTMFSTGGMANVHEYNNHNITSFDYIGYMTDCFVASGHNFPNVSDTLKLYKYKYNYWKNCPTSTSLPLVSESPKFRMFNQDFYSYYRYFWREELPVTTGETNIITTCETTE